MQKAGKILVKNLKIIVTGSSTRLGNALVKHLVECGSQVFALDQNILSNKRYGPNHHFERLNLARQERFKKFLDSIEPIDSLVNCAGFRSSYNYFLSYLISKQILEKMEPNPTNEFGCRGCIVNLAFTGAKFNEEYFREQDEFIQKYQINQETIDDDIYRLADLLTAARIRCNTLLIDEKLDEKMFSSLVKHVIEDQYIAGQVINMEDNLKHRTLEWDELHDELTRARVKKQSNDHESLKYVPPPELSDKVLKIKSDKPMVSSPNQTNA